MTASLFVKIAFLIGLVVELLILVRSLKNWLVILLVGLVLGSVFALLPSEKGGEYILLNQLEQIPVGISGILILISTYIFVSEEVSNPESRGTFTEGNALVCSLCFIYFSVEWTERYPFLQAFALISVIPLVLCLASCLTIRPLGRGARIGLGLWSSFMMLVLGFRYVIVMLNVPYAEIEQSLTNFKDTTFVFLQFAVFGASSVYIVDNFMKFVSYFPQRRDLSEHLEKRLDELTIN